jgi:hypothetical protein
MHPPPMHMIQYTVATADYQRWLKNEAANNGGQRKKRRR